MAVVYWAVVGALGAFGVAALLSVGIFVLPVVVLLVVAGVWSVRLRRGAAPGLLLGAGLVPLWLAWLNRSGPGTVCETTLTVQSCAEQWSPWPFLAVGLVLLAAGAALVVRRSGGGPSTAPSPGEVPRPV